MLSGGDRAAREHLERHRRGVGPFPSRVTSIWSDLIAEHQTGRPVDDLGEHAGGRGLPAGNRPLVGSASRAWRPPPPARPGTRRRQSTLTALVASAGVMEEASAPTGSELVERTRHRVPNRRSPTNWSVPFPGRSMDAADGRGYVEAA